MNDIPTLPKNLLIAMMIKNLFKERIIEEVRFWSASTICGRMSERIDLVCKSMRRCVVIFFKADKTYEQGFDIPKLLLIR